MDFHSHTCESDGTLEPQALADFMQERGVRVFSISDHDTVAAYGQFRPGPGARVVSGIELNTTFGEGEVHVLGYRIPTGASSLTAILERNREARRTRVQRMVAQLREAGCAIDMRDVEAEAIPRAALGRPHVGKALIRLGIVPDIQTAFSKYLTRGTAGYVPSTHMTPPQAVDAILASGGVPVLAHPGRLKDHAIIDELCDRGLQGLEVFYPSHDANQTAYFRAIAKRRNLVMSGGSDFHDIRYHTRGVGMEVEEEDIRPFLDLVMT